MIQPLSIVFFYQTQSSLILICLIHYLISVIRFINPFPLMAMFLCLTFSYPLHYMSSYTLESFSYYCSWRAFGWLIGSKCLLVLIVSCLLWVTDWQTDGHLHSLSCLHRWKWTRNLTFSVFLTNTVNCLSASKVSLLCCLMLQLLFFVTYYSLESGLFICNFLLNLQGSYSGHTFIFRSYVWPFCEKWSYFGLTFPQMSYNPQRSS